MPKKSTSADILKMLTSPELRAKAKEYLTAKRYSGKDYTYEQAYSDARSKGQKTFFWNGKYYNTDYEGAHGRQYREDVKSGKAQAFQEAYPGFANPELRKEKQEELDTYGITNEQTRNKTIKDKLARKIPARGYDVNDAISAIRGEHHSYSQYDSVEDLISALKKKYPKLKDVPLTGGYVDTVDGGKAIYLDDTRELKKPDKVDDDMWQAFINDVEKYDRFNALGGNPEEIHRAELDYLLGYPTRESALLQDRGIGNKPMISKYRTGSVPYYYTTSLLEASVPFYPEKFASRRKEGDPFEWESEEEMRGFDEGFDRFTDRFYGEPEYAKRWRDLGVDMYRGGLAIDFPMLAKSGATAADLDTLASIKAFDYVEPLSLSPGNHLAGSGNEEYYIADRPKEYSWYRGKYQKYIDYFNKSKEDHNKYNDSNVNTRDWIYSEPSLGTYTLGVPKDTSFVSVWDKFDIDPFGSGNDKPIIQVGKPFEYYTRFYPEGKTPDIDSLYKEFNTFDMGGNKEDREERKRIDAVTNEILRQDALRQEAELRNEYGPRELPLSPEDWKFALGMTGLSGLSRAIPAVGAEMATFGPLYKQAAKTLLTDIPAFETIDRLPTLWGRNRLTEEVGSGVEKGVRYIMPDGKAENIIAPTLGTIARFAAGMPIGGVSHLMSQNVGNIMNATADAAGRIAQDNIVRRATNSLLPVEEIYGAAEREVPALMAEPAAQNATPIYEAYRRAINMPERFSNPWVGFRAPSERFAEPTYRYIEELTPEQIEGINLGLNPGDPGYIDLNLNRIAAGVNMRRTARQSVDDYIARLSEARWPRDVSAADRARNSRYDRFLNFNLPETSRNYRPTSVTPDGIPDDARALAARRNAVDRTNNNVNGLRQRLGQPPISGQSGTPSQAPTSSGPTQQPRIVGNVFADRYGISADEFERLLGAAPNGRQRDLHELMQTARNLETEAGGLENLRTMLSEGRLPGYSSTSASPGTSASPSASSAAAASSVAGRRPFSLADTEAEYTTLSDEFRANRYNVSEATINDYKRRAADILEREAKAYADSIPDEELVGTLTDAMRDMSANEYYSGHTALADILRFRESHGLFPNEIKSRALGKAVKERLLKVPGTNTKINSENLINAYSLPDEELTALKDYLKDGRVLNLADTLGLADDLTSESFGGAGKLADYIDNIDYIKDFINAAKSGSPLPKTNGIKVFRQRDARDYLYNSIDHLKLSSSDKGVVRKAIEDQLYKEAKSLPINSDNDAWSLYFGRARDVYEAEAPRLSANNSTSFEVVEAKQPVSKAKLRAMAKRTKEYFGDRADMPELDVSSPKDLAKVQKYVRENKLVPDEEALPLDIEHMYYFSGGDPKLEASAGLKAYKALEQYYPGMANSEYNVSIASAPMRPRVAANNYGENPGETSAIFLKGPNGDYRYTRTNRLGKERLYVNDDGTIDTAHEQTSRIIKRYGNGEIDPTKQYLTSDEVRLLRSGNDGSQEYAVALEKWRELAKKMDTVALNKMLSAQNRLKAAALAKGYNLDVPMAKLPPDSYYSNLDYTSFYNPTYSHPLMMLLRHDMGGPLLRNPYANGGQINSFPNGGKFITTLPSNKEDAFQRDWQAYASLHNLAMNPDDPEHYYDYRGFWDTNKKSSAVNPFTWETKSTDGHLPDTWKTPGHPTFSGESVYAKDAPGLAGSWENGVYIPPAKVDQDTIKFLQRYAESSFNDAAVSDAGAIGAYQLMPDTANEHALRLGIDGDLFDPTYNEALRDSAYNQFYNSEVATSGYPTDINRTLRALLMYNAGWGRARTILRNLAEKGYDINGSTDWVDAIPYKESRNYLKFVGLQQDIPGTGFTRAQLEKAAKAHGYTIPTPVDTQKVSKAYGMLKKACGGDITRMRAMFNKIKS